jgi:outer membrane translocation and assembly module TamA
MTQQWALVGFVGQAALFDNDDLNGDDFYASAGGGIRYRLSKQRPVNLRVDFAIGEGGSSGFYVGLSEAF